MAQRIAQLLLVLVSLTAAGGAANADGSGYVIAVHLSSRKPPATGPEEVAAIRDFINGRAALINQAGGINGHPLQIEFFDDQSDVNKTTANVDAALKIPNIIAMVGLWNSTRGASVVERIGASGVPLISELSVDRLFSAYPNIFTLTRSVRDEQNVFAKFAIDGFSKLAFVGAEDDLYTKAYFEQFDESLGGQVSRVSTFWLKDAVADHDDDVAKAIDDIKQSGADLLFLSIGSQRGAKFLARLAAADISIPVFIGLGSVNGLAGPNAAGRDYAGTLYEIAEGGIANLNNERLEQLLRRPDALPEGRTYSSYSVGYGARYADLVALIAEVANSSPAWGAETVRAHVRSEISALAAGSRVWRGWAQDWSFTPERASAEHSLLVWRPKGQIGSTLAPTQYVRSGTGGLIPIPVLYIHLNMVRIFHVDSADKSFEAEFFFTLRSDRLVPVKDIEFTNAELSKESARPLINVREVHREGDAAHGQPSMRIYKVNGRFRFEPDLRKYPFDQQIFSISFQPAKTSAPFFIQPPSDAMRRNDFSVDGWHIENHYVGTNELIIRSIAGTSSEERVIPYYNFNYTWVMKRQVIDYVLRVIVPLSFILIVAYIAIFIPRSELQAIMGIQVTALLSAIALYFALNQPGADDATLSDIIFLMAYAAISLMIVLSVLEVNTRVASSHLALRAINVSQVYLVPVLALATIGFVIASASYDMSLPKLLLRVGLPLREAL